MIRTILFSTLVLVLLSALGTSLYSGAQASKNISEAELQIGNEIQVSDFKSQDLENTTADNQKTFNVPEKNELTAGNKQDKSSDLTIEEIEGLLYMLEEEKLARDVYTTLYATWQLSVFNNIAASEQAHMDAVAGLIDKYSLEESASSVPGVFNNPELQSLYNELVGRGSKSVSEALYVGAAIEEIDILDLQSYLSQTDNPDIKQVFNNLMRGSENHLRAFTSVLSRRTSETYIPQYLSMEQYTLITSQSFQGSGNGYRGNGMRANKGYGSGSN